MNRARRRWPISIEKRPNFLRSSRKIFLTAPMNLRCIFRKTPMNSRGCRKLNYIFLLSRLPKAPKATKSPCICRIICPSCSTQKTEIFARRCITHTLPVHLISLRQARTIFRSSTVCLNFVLKMLTSWAIKTSLKFPWFGKWPSLPNRSFLSYAS